MKISFLKKKKLDNKISPSSLQEENKKFQLFAIVGKSGSGKDSILNAALAAAPSVFHRVEKFTTRPKREGEEDGVEYHFLTDEEYTNKFINGELLDTSFFRGWFYGTENSLSEKQINIGVFDPIQLAYISNNPLINLRIFEVSANDKTRLERSLKRENRPDVEEILRRFDADDKDFEDIQNYPCQYYTVLYNDRKESFDKNVKIIVDDANHLYLIGE